MECTSCGRVNGPDARFCGECGRPIVARCPACSIEVAPDLKFCEGCGADLRGPRDAASRETRKVVTVVFADLVGSTSLHERLDAESTRRVMERYYAVLRASIEAHDGTVVKLLGDGVLAAFGVPHVREDDALRAVRAAVAMQDAFRELSNELAHVGPLALRIGVNSGEVVVSDDDSDIVGDPVNVAARLQQAAGDGEVIIGDTTRRLVGTLLSLEPIGELPLKGRAETVPAHRVVSLDRPATTRTTTFVGRDDELQRVLVGYDAAVAQGRAQMTVILGSPGLGKSRLLDEAVRRVADEAAVLAVRCEPGGSTFAPLAGALRTFAGLADSAHVDAARATVAALVPDMTTERDRIVNGIVDLLGGAPASPEASFYVVRRFLAALGTDRPVVLVLDDLHWAEPLLLDLTEHLVEWSTDVALLVLVAARPELRDVRSALATPGRLVRDVIALDGLDATAAARLAADVVGTDELPAVVAGHVLAASEGNPLFLGELVRMLVEDGTVHRAGEQWVAAVDLREIELPPTIHAVLAARIERLHAEERTVLERAAVVGRHFSRAAVAELLPPDQRAQLDVRLEALRRAELIEPDATWFLGEPVLRFHHVLIREAAYQGMLKETRAELHVRYADWLAARATDLTEHDETLGWHVEHAYQYRADLGPIDAESRVLGERAARHLSAAGRRALARDDVDAAAGLLGRALRLLDADDTERADLSLDWCEAVLSAGDVDHAAAAIDELARWTADDLRLRAWHACFAGQYAVLTDPLTLSETAGAVATAAAQLETVGDDAGEAKAHFVHAQALVRLGQVGACEAALDRALVAARRIGDWRRANAVLAGAPGAALWGPSPVTRASGRCLDVVRVLRITSGSPAVEAVALRCQAVLEALRGRANAARKMLASSRRTVEELGLTQRILEADLYAGIVELYDGDTAAAETPLRAAYEGLRERGLSNDAAQAAALLGRALLGQGRVDEAERLSHESEALAGQNLKAAIAWRGVRAEALARRGDHAAALELANAAVEIAAATDALLDHADARVALATVLRTAGRAHDADAAVARAVELWDTKGATALADRARTERPVEAASAPDQPSEAPTPRHVRENAATVNVARFASAFASRDPGVLADLIVENSTWLHHPTGVTYGSVEARIRFKDLFAHPNASYVEEALAALGDRLALLRQSLSLPGVKLDEHVWFGRSEVELFTVLDVDEAGRRNRVESFASDHLAHAVSRLYERYAELQPEGPERARAMTTARSIATMLASAVDPDRYSTATASDAQLVDHRTLGFGTIEGADAMSISFRALRDLAEDMTWRVEDVIDLRQNRVLLRVVATGTLREGGGYYQREMLILDDVGPDGLIDRIEYWEGDQVAEALARFDALAGATTAPTFENLAVRALAEEDRRFEARDWEGLVANIRRDAEYDDRRAGIRTTVRGEAFIAHFRLRFSAGSTRHGNLLATRGDRLALFRSVYAATDRYGGESEFLTLDLREVDAVGRMAAIVTFDVDDLDAAHDELDDRFAAGEGAPYAELFSHWKALRNARSDVEVLRRLLPDDFSHVTHRLVGGTGERISKEAFIAMVGDDLEAGVREGLHIDHYLRLSPRALVAAVTWFGTVDGGRFETPMLQVTAHDGHRFHSWETYDLDQLDEALARYDELNRDAPFANAATRQADQSDRAMAAGDWDALAALHAPDRVVDDRRALFRTRFVGEECDANLRTFCDARPTFERELLATRGDRLALYHQRVAVAGRRSGPAEWETLELREVDAPGQGHCFVILDADDLDAAYAELDARFAAGEAAPYANVWNPVREYVDAVEARDFDRWTETLAPGLVMEEHRLVWRGTHGRDDCVARLRSLFEFAPDTRLRADHVLALSDRAILTVATWHGTRDGGPFETTPVNVMAIDPTGKIARWDAYELDQIDEARARFTEIGQQPRTIEIPPNSATRARDRGQRLIDAQDWAGLRAMCADDMVSDDRQSHVHMVGGRDQFVANLQYGAAAGVRLARTTLAAPCDRVALERYDYRAGPGGTQFEVSLLAVTEVDADDRIVATIIFDVDDVEAAWAELLERFERSDEVRALPAAALRFARAMAEHDLEACRAALPADFVRDDHRRTGLGLIEGTEAYLAVCEALWELDVVVAFAPLAILMWNRRGVLHMARGSGTFEGGRFENVFLRLMVFRDDQVARVELFELDDLDAARARFDELCPDDDASLIPPNAALRTRGQWDTARLAGQWDAARALVADSFAVDDRRAGLRVHGDAEMWLRSTEHVMAGHDVQLDRTPLGVLGDRIAVERYVWRGGPVGAPFEIEHLSLTEVDGDGLLVAIVVFDRDDLPDGMREARERLLVGEASEHAAALAPVFAFEEAFWNRDWDAMRTSLGDDYVLVDRRALGVMDGQDPDGHIASRRVMVDLAPDVKSHFIRVIRWDNHGMVAVGRLFGTLRDGGPFEDMFVAVFCTGHGRITYYEVFEPEEVDRALARFEELRPAAPEPPIYGLRRRRGPAGTLPQ
jgi:class 3 adenylate cyclase